MAGVPEGFHRVNFNCPDALWRRLQHEVTMGPQGVAAVMREALEQYLNGLLAPGLMMVKSDALQIDMLAAPTEQEALAARMAEPSAEQLEQADAAALAGVDSRLL